MTCREWVISHTRAWSISLTEFMSQSWVHGSDISESYYTPMNEAYRCVIWSILLCNMKHIADWVHESVMSQLWVSHIILIWMKHIAVCYDSKRGSHITHTWMKHIAVCYRVATISRLLKITLLSCKEPYKRDYILQKRPIILRSLLIVATPPYEGYRWLTSWVSYEFMNQSWVNESVMSESCHTHEWSISHIWMSHVAHMNESCRTRERRMIGVTLYGKDEGHVIECRMINVMAYGNDVHHVIWEWWHHVTWEGWSSCRRMQNDPRHGIWEW